MKIIIVGAGVGGLVAYQFFRKLLDPSEHSIKIYEAQNAPSTITPANTTIGGGLGLAPNGLRVLHSLSPELAAKIIAQGFSNSTYTFRNSSGRTLGRLTNGSLKRYGFEGLMIARQSVHDAVREGVEVEYSRRIVDVKEVGSEVEILFDSGQTERADMVVGADGIRSVARRSIMGKEFEAEYHGLTGVGSFLHTSLLSQNLMASLTTDPVVMTFGRCGFFGYSLCNSARNRIMWWSTFPAETPPTRRTFSFHELRAQLLERHGNWISPVNSLENKPFREMIELACDPEKSKDQVLVLPVYIAPTLPRFASESGRVILLGDAAHAMPPDSGQGISMALEDAETITLLLSKILPDSPSESDALKKVSKYYTTLRKPRVDAIIAEAKKRGNAKRNLSWWGEFVRDLIIRILCLLPEGWLADGKFGYVVSRTVESALKQRR